MANIPELPPKHIRILDQGSYRAQSLNAMFALQTYHDNEELRWTATTQAAIKPHNYNEAMLTSSDAEIAAWNVAVADKKQAKRAAKYGKSYNWWKK